MQQKLINYYSKIVNLALENKVKGKSFPFRAKLNNDVFLKQVEDHLRKVYKKSGGEGLPDLDKFMSDIKGMYKIANKHYKNSSAEELAKNGIRGYEGKNNWNLETYTNMYFTHMNNEMVRLGRLDYIRRNGLKIKISKHNTICDLCKPWEGKVLNENELETARESGLFHPNCRHFIIETD